MQLLKADTMTHQPDYGFDYFGNEVEPEKGYVLVERGDVIQPKDKPFDVYAGWMQSDGYHARNEMRAYSRGRWTTWERPLPVVR